LKTREFRERPEIVPGDFNICRRLSVLGRRSTRSSSELKIDVYWDSTFAGKQPFRIIEHQGTVRRANFELRIRLYTSSRLRLFDETGRPRLPDRCL
jgi:hypothetical protein